MTVVIEDFLVSNTPHVSGIVNLNNANPKFLSHMSRVAIGHFDAKVLFDSLEEIKKRHMSSCLEEGSETVGIEYFLPDQDHPNFDKISSYGGILLININGVTYAISPVDPREELCD